MLCIILHVSAQPQLSSLQTDARVLLWFYHTVQAAMLLCKHTAGGVTALNEIHTAQLHHSVMIATCTWPVSTRSMTSPSRNVSAILTYTSYVLFLIHSW